MFNDDYEDELPEGPAIARITGRIGRIDPAGQDGQKVDVWLVVEDLGFEDDFGEPKAGVYQAIKVRATVIQLGRMHAESRSPVVTMSCTFHRGMLQLNEILDVQDCNEPLPNVRIPLRKEDRPNPTDGKLIDPSQLENMVNKGGWTSQAHSVYRIPVAWHLVMCPKYRRPAFANRAAEVQRILRSVAEAEGMEVVALAAEPDHVHLLMRGMTPQTNWSAWIGRWKAVTSRNLKLLEGLEDFSWQVGYSLNAVAGGRQGAEEALRAVEGYIRAQGDQADEAEARVPT